MSAYFLSIDNGGTSTKIVIFNEKGEQIEKSVFPTLCVEDKVGFREIDLDNLWQSICVAIKEALLKSDLNGEDIKAISCVGHGKGAYFLNKEKQIFCRGILSTDTRGKDLSESFETRIEEIWEISQQHVVAAQSPVLLKWLKENSLEIYNNIGYVLSAKDFIRYQLTGELWQEIGDASGNNIINLGTKEYDRRLFDFFDISETIDCFPPLITSSEIAGYITKDVSERTGLLEGTPVVGGLFDIDACALASGVVNEDKFNIIAGTWSINIYPSDTPAPRDSGLMNSLFPGDKFLIEGSSATSAGNLNTMLKIMMNEELINAENNQMSIYDILEDFLEQTDASFSKVIFLPFLYGSNTVPTAQSCFIGMSSKTTKSELIRAVYEGIIFSHKMHYNQLTKCLGRKPKVIRLSGGVVNSPNWMQMFADVLDVPVETVEATEQGALGGAITASVGSKYYSSIEEAITHMVHRKNIFYPCEKMVKLYQKKYEMYQQILISMMPVWNNLEKMRIEMENG